MADIEWAGVDARDESFVADPYPEYERLRAEARMHRLCDIDGKESLLINRYGDVREALTDRRLSTRPREELLRFRNLVGRAFTPRRIERLRPRIQATADEVLDGVASEERVDLVRDVALPFTLTVNCELLGVPPEDRQQFRDWYTPDSAGGRRDRYGREEGPPEEGRRYFAQLVARRRRTTRTDLSEDEQPDLVSVLMAAHDEGEQLTEWQMVSTLALLLGIGHETTVQLIADGMLALMDHPDQLRLLRERPELGPSAVEELLRYTNPVQRGSFRYATEEVAVGDHTIPAGCRVSAGIASANRDPERFADPDRLDITRADNQHLTFGHGAHFCLGSPLVRQEARIMFAGLVLRFPDMSLACAPSELRRSGMRHALGSLPVWLRGDRSATPQQ